jgi:IclR family transcriptional regulator, pca regulon regulatory protein
MPRTGPPTLRVADGEVLPSIPTLMEPRYSQSLERGLAILECFTAAKPVLGIADIADELGMSSSTTHRYVITLVALGYLRQIEKRKYRLALPVVALGMSAMSSTSLAEHARPYLEDLCQRSGFTVSLAVLDGPEVLLVDRLRGNRRGQQLIDFDHAPGSQLPGYCTAVGKLLLAELPEHEQRHALGETTLRKRTRHTITSKTLLRAELERIRGQSLVSTGEELADGLYSVAAPIREESGEATAAVGMDAHHSTISLAELVGALGPHLIATADRVSARLGFRRRDEMNGAFSLARVGR